MADLRNADEPRGEPIWLVTASWRRTCQKLGGGGPTIAAVVDWSWDIREAHRIAEALTVRTGKKHFVSAGRLTGYRKPRRQRDGTSQGQRD